MFIYYSFNLHAPLSLYVRLLVNTSKNMSRGKTFIYIYLTFIFLHLYFSWSRQLIEDATGYYSGSIYSEGTMVQNGFIGEYDDPSSGRTIVVKNHGQNKMEYADGIILVVRNPYNAIIADYNRQTSHSHTGSANLSKFKGPAWDKFVVKHTSRWATG